MFKTLVFQPENGFFRALHQITAVAYLVRD